MISHSDDGGRAGSPPRRVASSEGETESTFATIATAANGDVYVAWLHGSLTGRLLVQVARSTDGGDRFGRPRLVGDVAVRRTPSCRGGTWTIPASPGLPVSPSPTVLVDGARRQVDVVYGRSGCNGARSTWT